MSRVRAFLFCICATGAMADGSVGVELWEVVLAASTGTVAVTLLLIGICDRRSRVETSSPTPATATTPQTAATRKNPQVHILGTRGCQSKPGEVHLPGGYAFRVPRSHAFQ